MFFVSSCALSRRSRLPSRVLFHLTPQRPAFDREKPFDSDTRATQLLAFKQTHYVRVLSVGVKLAGAYF